MKIASQLLALCVVHPTIMWGTTTAFVITARTGRPNTVTALAPPGRANVPRLFSTPGDVDISNYSDPQSSYSDSSSISKQTSSRGSGGGSTTGRSNMSSNAKSMTNIKNMWDSLKPIKVQGSSLRTWSFTTSNIQRVQVMLRSDGRPLRATIDLWQGPDNTPQTMAVYNEDGSLRPFLAVVETPRGQNAISIQNTGQMEFPLYACLAADVEQEDGNMSLGLADLTNELQDQGASRIIQGGALHTYAFDSYVSSVQILLTTDGRPLNAQIELLQGPNNKKQVIELYCEDGQERPFFAVIETPGSGNVVRIVNTATMEFPLTARVEPYVVDSWEEEGGESGSGFFVVDGQ